MKTVLSDMMLTLVESEDSSPPVVSSTSFCTSKELDPDFIAFNVRNRRYHFPARFYLPNRGLFGQVDPRILANSSIDVGALYGYVEGMPTEAVDPDGLVIRIQRRATNIVEPQVHVATDNCPCGTATVESMLDADTSAGKQASIRGWTTPHGNAWLAGVAVMFSWDPKNLPGHHNGVCKLPGDNSCCPLVGWKQWKFKGGSWTPDSADPNAWYNVGTVDPQGRPVPRNSRSMFDYPSYHSSAPLIMIWRDLEFFFKSQLVCILTNQVLYSIDWKLKLTRTGVFWGREHNARLKVNGMCGDSGNAAPNW